MVLSSGLSRRVWSELRTPLRAEARGKTEARRRAAGRNETAIERRGGTLREAQDGTQAPDLPEAARGREEGLGTVPGRAAGLATGLGQEGAFSRNSVLCGLCAMRADARDMCFFSAGAVLKRSCSKLFSRRYGAFFGRRVKVLKAVLLGRLFCMRF